MSHTELTVSHPLWTKADLADTDFNRLVEAKVLIERWREHSNRIRPHSALGYRPPVPEAIELPAPPAA